MKEEIKGEVTIFLSTLFFAIAAVLVKLVSSNFDGFFIALSRFVVGIILGAIIIIAARRKFKLYDKRLLLLRGLFGGIAIVLYYVAIQITSSGRATLLTYTYPVFVAIFGYTFFKEHIEMKTVLSVFICLLGIILVFYDGSKYSMLGNTIGLLAGMFSGFAIHYIKKSREKNDPLIVYMDVCLFGLVFSIFSLKQAATLNLSLLIFLILLGSIVFLAQILMGYGYKHVPATKGSIISFLTVPLTIFFSYFIGEEMTFRFFLGAALVIGGIIINKRKKPAIIHQ